MNKHKLLDSETILPDDYPMYPGYVYIIDNVLSISDDGCTVGRYKIANNVKEIRRCEIYSHGDAKVGDMILPKGELQ